MRLRLASFAIFSAMAAATAACAGIFGFERLAVENRPYLCEGITPPSSGTAASGEKLADGSGAPIYVAFKSFHYDADPIRPGFNLDQRCTSSPETNRCTLRDPGTDFKEFAQDGDGGVDNAFASLPQRLSAATNEPGSDPEFSAASLTADVQSGRFGIVVELNNWNGTSEDTSVNVAVYPALGVWMLVDGAYAAKGEPTDAGVRFSIDEAIDAGLLQLPDVSSIGQRIDLFGDAGLFIPGGLWDGGMLVPGGPPKPVAPPAFNGSDLWMRDARFTLPVSAHEAYVTGGVLVAKFERFILPVRAGNDRKMFDIDLDDAELVAKLTPSSGNRVTLSQGTLAGTWQTAKLIEEIRTLFVKLAGQAGYVCQFKDLIFDNFKNVICRRSDSHRGDGTDASPPASCDAISVGIGFETYSIDQPGPFYDDSRQFHPLDGGPDAEPHTGDVIRLADRCKQPGDVPPGSACE